VHHSPAKASPSRAAQALAVLVRERVELKSLAFGRCAAMNSLKAKKRLALGEELLGLIEELLVRLEVGMAVVRTTPVQALLLRTATATSSLA
jgi:hypothetical protein